MFRSLRPFMILLLALGLCLVLFSCGQNRTIVEIDGVEAIFSPDLNGSATTGDIYLVRNSFFSLQDILALDCFVQGAIPDVARIHFDLSYNPTLANGDRVETGIPLEDVDCGSGCVITETAIDASAKLIHFDMQRTAPAPGVELPDGASWIGRITWFGTTEGTFRLDFSNMGIEDSNGTPITSPALIWNGGTVTVKHL